MPAGAEEKEAGATGLPPHLLGLSKGHLSWVVLPRVTHSAGCLPFLDVPPQASLTLFPAQRLAPCPAVTPPCAQRNSDSPRFSCTFRILRFGVQVLPESGVEQEKLWFWSGWAGERAGISALGGALSPERAKDKRCWPLLAGDHLSGPCEAGAFFY